eukprot:1162009-Pelagomonas_calceolata.AAC.8
MTSTYAPSTKARTLAPHPQGFPTAHLFGQEDDAHTDDKGARKGDAQNNDNHTHTHTHTHTANFSTSTHSPPTDSRSAHLFGQENDPHKDNVGA